MLRKNVIYTRFSSDMQRDESCEDQEREVRRALENRGIDPASFQVLHDRAISGTKAERPQFGQLREMINRGEIGILAVDDQARFSRADTTYSLITDLVFHGGRFISTGEGIDTHQQGWDLRVKVMELHNSTAIKELGRRVRRGQEGRVLDDGSAGDFPFGYESYFLDPNWFEALQRGPKPKKGVRILDDEARWVRQVFTWFADEQRSIGWIARELTRLEVSKGRKATTVGWHHHQVRRMLQNSKYAGLWQWGKTKTLRDSQGKIRQIPVSDGQIVVRERPTLRIVDPITWEKAQRRLQELGQIYGQKPGQKRRGSKPHHSAVYPQNLLSGLLYCDTCGARLYAQAGETIVRYGCPNHPKGLCSVASRVPGDKAERAILDLVSKILRECPGWIQQAVEAMRLAVREHADQIPKLLQDDESRLEELESRIDKLVDALADGSESPAIRRRLGQMEGEAETIRHRIEEGRRARKVTVEMPDDVWIRDQLCHLPSLLAYDRQRTARLVRRLFGKVRAEAIIAPGKKRGFSRLHVRIQPAELLREALGDKFPDRSSLEPGLKLNTTYLEYQLDLGAPTRCDLLAPEIAAMREQGKKWEEIGRVTGLGTGNAQNVWKRWIDAQAKSSVESA